MASEILTAKERDSVARLLHTRGRGQNVLHLFSSYCSSHPTSFNELYVQDTGVVDPQQLHDYEIALSVPGVL